MIATPIQIRFGDCDMAGHVHNASYLHYFESARINFFVSQLGRDWDWKKFGLILKKNVVEHFVPSFLEDELMVEVCCSHIGTKSFTLSYRVLNQKNELKATGESVIVCYDYHKSGTIDIPAPIKKALENHPA